VCLCSRLTEKTFILHFAFSALTLLFGRQEGHRTCKKLEWWGAGVVICLERGGDLHTAQLMPLPLTVSCFSKIQIGFTFLVPAHPGSPGQRSVKRVCVWQLHLKSTTSTATVTYRMASCFKYSRWWLATTWKMVSFSRSLTRPSFTPTRTEMVEYRMMNSAQSVLHLLLCCASVSALLH